MNQFDKYFEELIGHEGGYVNDPNDRGGETKYGISKRSYPNLDIKNLTLEQAKEIYYNDFYLKYKIERLPEHIRKITFDMCVNFGARGAVKVLQEACNYKGKNNLVVDGMIGPNTINACKNVSVELIRAYRMLRFTDIVRKRPQNKKFWFGWYRRCLKV